MNMTLQIMDVVYDLLADGRLDQVLGSAAVIMEDFEQDAENTTITMGDVERLFFNVDRLVILCIYLCYLAFAAAGVAVLYGICKGLHWCCGKKKDTDFTHLSTTRGTPHDQTMASKPNGVAGSREMAPLKHQQRQSGRDKL